jgi:hypothetical protein
MYSRDVVFGLTGVNLINAVSWNSPDNTIERNPFYLKASAAGWFLNRQLVIGFDYDLDKINRYHLGTEFWYQEMVALRGGLNGETPTLGLGFRYDMLQIDYTWIQYQSPLDNVNVISVTLGDARKLELAAPEIIVPERL